MSETGAKQTNGNPGSNQNLAKPRWWEETALWAITPFFGYFFAYLYECGYCSAFNIPAYLIQIELATVLAFSAILLSFAFFLVPIIDTCFYFMTDARSNWGKLLGRYFPFPVLSILLFYFSAQWQLWIVPLCLGVLMFIQNVGDAIVFKDRNKKFAQRLAEGNMPMMYPG